MVEMMMVGVVTFPMHESAIRTEIDNNVNRDDAVLLFFANKANHLTIM